MYYSLTLKDLADLAGIVAATSNKTKSKGRKGSALWDMIKSQGSRADRVPERAQMEHNKRQAQDRCGAYVEADKELLKLTKFGPKASQLVEERGPANYHPMESTREQRPRPDDSISSDVEYRWERGEGVEEGLSFPHGRTPSQVSRETCQERDIHGVQDPCIERGDEN